MTTTRGDLDLTNEVDEITDILNMPIGTTICYHRGFLAVDRGVGREKKNRTPRECAVDETGAIAWGLYEAGRVVLVQKRVADGDYKYLAQRVK